MSESKQVEQIMDELSRPKTKTVGFSKMVRLYQERLYWHIRKMLLSHEDSDDVLQNTFMKAWNGIDSFRGESKLSTWLYRIATNETLTFLANKRLRNLAGIEDIESLMIAQLRADSYFSGDEAEMKLQEAILTLPEKQRLVFNMKYFSDMTFNEMEEILGTSVGALKASYHHAVKKIESFIKEDKIL